MNEGRYLKKEVEYRLLQHPDKLYVCRVSYTADTTASRPPVCSQSLLHCAYRCKQTRYRSTEPPVPVINSIFKGITTQGRRCEFISMQC